MPSFNPFGAAEEAVGGAVIELIKLAAQDRRDFEQVFKDTLIAELKARGNRNTSIVNTVVDQLRSDPEIQKWLHGTQLSGELNLLQALAGKLKLDVLFLQDFFLAYENAVVKNDALNKTLQNRRAANRTQSLQDILRTLSGQRTATQIQNELAVLRRYRERIRHDFSTIMLFGDRKRGEESVFARMSDMQAGFIQLHLKYWRDELDLPKLREGGKAGLEIEDVFFQNRERLILIRGLPGSGKTTLLRYLTWRFAEETPSSPLLPVYLRLKTFKLGKKSLADFIRQGMRKVCPDRAAEKVLLSEDCFLENPMILLLDGIDEIEDADSHAGFAEALNDFALDHPRCALIAASRPLGLEKSAYPEFTPLDLDKLAPEMIDAYLGQWFAGDANKITALRNTLEVRPRMQALAQNPFLLSMICFTYAEGGDAALVGRRSTLYAECTEFLLKRLYDRESAKSVKVEKDQAMNMLKDLALRFFLWQESDFPVDQVNVLARRVLSPRDLRLPEKFLNRLQKETGLIQRAAEGFTFVHRSLWEYFTALALRDDKKPDFVIRHAANPDWEEVVRLYAGLLPQAEEVKKLVHGLWQINRPLALRVTTEITTPAADLLKPLIEQEEGNQGKLLLIDALAQSLPLILDEGARHTLVQETLTILLIDCEEKDCQVIYHAQMLLEKLGLQPLEPGGLLYQLFDLDHALERQQDFLRDPTNHFEWIEIKGDTFWMGDDEHEPDERPAHQVKVDSFRLAKHPVTNRMLASFPFGVKYRDEDERLPATGNTWFEAYYCCLWIGCRLPTEAEWEYAARGGVHVQRTQYYFGDSVEELANHAWFGDTVRREAHAVDEPNPHSGKENLNPLGLANMLGNVWEWCADWFGSNYYNESPKRNPKGPETGTQRMLRGGAWSNYPLDLRCAYRNWDYPTYRNALIGFRCAQDSR